MARYEPISAPADQWIDARSQARRLALLRSAGLLAWAGFGALRRAAAEVSETDGAALKIILVPRRHPSMTRPQFFDYLAHQHAALVKSVPEFTRYLKRYVQNHTRLPNEGAAVATPFRRALDRDSVIELWFDDVEGLHKGLAEPRYQELIRPDEARFNDLSSLIVTATTRIARLKAQGEPVKYKLFDVLKRRGDLNRSTFMARWQQHLTLLASRPGYRELARRVELNGVVPDDNNPFGQPADFDGIQETWVSNFEDAGKIAALRMGDAVVLKSESAFVDWEASFSVLAIENPIINPPAWGV